MKHKRHNVYLIVEVMPGLRIAANRQFFRLVLEKLCPVTFSLIYSSGSSQTAFLGSIFSIGLGSFGICPVISRILFEKTTK